MVIMNPRVLLAGLCLLLPATAAAQQKSAKSDTVALRFAWPQGLTATIDAERIRTRAQNGDSTASSLSYRMQARAGKGKELLIRFSDFEVESEEAAEPQLMEQVAGLVPNYRVSTQGEFLGVHEVSALKARMDSMFASMLAEDRSGEFKALFQSLLSEQYLNGATAQEWNSLVGMWVGADLELGQVYELEEETPIPIIPGAVVTMVSEFAIEERVSCEDGGTKTECVQIRLYAEPDSVAMKKVLQQFMEKIAGAGRTDVPVFENLSIRSELLLITRPETLVPYYMELIKVVEGKGRLGEETSPFSQVDRRRYWYTYDR